MGNKQETTQVEENEQSEQEKEMERAQRCNEKIVAVLKEENCSLVPTLNVTGGHLHHVVQVIPNQKESKILTPKK